MHIMTAHAGRLRACQGEELVKIVMPLDGQLGL